MLFLFPSFSAEQLIKWAILTSNISILEKTVLSQYGFIVRNLPPIPKANETADIIIHSNLFDAKSENGSGQDDFCPTIASTDPVTYFICFGDSLPFTVITDASGDSFKKVVFFRFESEQSNPYTSLAPKVRLGEFVNETTIGTINFLDFPLNVGKSKTYFVYAMLDPHPVDPVFCPPYLEYQINVSECSNKMTAN